MKYKLLIFDFDGTLINTEHSIIYAMKKTLKKIINKVPTDKKISETIGLPLNISLTTLGVNDEALEAAEKLYREIYMDTFQDTIKLFNNVKKVLPQLQEKNIPLTVATNRSRTGMFQILNYFNLTDFFSFLVAKQDVKNPKPAPDMGTMILNHFGTKPEETLIIGDTVYDILLGKKTGCDTCWATYGYGKKDDILKIKPTYTIDNFEELLNIIT
jgi:phosphoglycolate phosphatase